MMRPRERTAAVSLAMHAMAEGYSGPAAVYICFGILTPELLEEICADDHANPD